MSATDAPPLVRLSCFHGDDWQDFLQDKWTAAGPLAPIKAAYLDAVRRLPIDDMPDLLECLYLGGHCVGLLDPASNVILNGLNLLYRRRAGAYSSPSNSQMPPDPRHKGAWSLIAFRSYEALLAFMHTYFRYLTQDQARFYLHLSGGDLAVAIRIAELEQFAAVNAESHHEIFSDRAEFALRVAAVKAEHPMPEDVVLLCQPALQELSEDMKAVLAALEEGRCLTVDDVQVILDVLQSQHRTVLRTVSFARKLNFARYSDHYCAPFSSTRFGYHYFNAANARGGQRQQQQRAPFSLADLRSPEVIRRKLHTSLAVVLEHTPQTPTDAPPTCKHIEYLKMGLLDTIHAFYLEAIARLPGAALRWLVRGVLMAGHCYGPLDPVSNIILHAVWYSVVVPPLHQHRGEPDILSVATLLRLEVRSLDGLVAAVRAATGFSEHRAVEYLCTSRCDVSAMLQRADPEIRAGAFGRASAAARHPLGGNHSSFLASLASGEPALLDTLSSLLDTGVDQGRPGRVSDDSITELQSMLGDRYSPIAPAPALNDAAELDNVRPWKVLLEKKQRFLRTEIVSLLRSYADEHPWEPKYKLEIICGVEKNSRYLSLHCYHVNFIAASASDTRMLFFAQVWEEKRADNTEECVHFGCLYSDRESEVSFCCPLPNYSAKDAYLGAWLECSLDPIEGNGKKGEQFWDDIAVLYNSTTTSNRKRDRNQLKMEWQRTKKRLAAFHGEWLAVIGVYHSGHNTNDLEKMALEKYEGNYHQPFQHLTMWAKLKDDGKWLASYNHMIKKAGKSPSVETNLTSNELNLEAEKRPSADRDKAKVERAGKGKSGGLSQELGERLDKFIEVNNQSMEDRQKVIDSQVLLSNQQLETAKINNKTKMLDVYSKMLLADTSKMDDGEKARRSKALSRMEAMLFPGDSGDQGGTDGSAAPA
ncbi:hypothetical protein ACQ4PT_016637 [Festuca glaucescens]